jgi:hypothetical protein
MKFFTAINCIDGRVQMPVISYLRERFNVDCVDSITEAGPNCILANPETSVRMEAIFEKLSISIEKHQSQGIAIVGHHDCAGNPASKEEQIGQIERSAQLLQKQFQNVEVIGLWVDCDWKVHEVCVYRTGE